MDIIEQMRNQDNFTSSEQDIINLILNKPEMLLSNTTSAQLGAAAYTSASTVVRLCKKLGCRSFADFKTTFISQYQKRESAHIYVDASLPFKKTDTPEEVMEQLTELERISLRQTHSLMDPQTYGRVVKNQKHASSIYVYGSGNNVKLLHDFAYKMGSIHRQVRISPDHQQQMLCAITEYDNHCAIVVSYSGESTSTLRYARLLKKNHIPTISITSCGSNSLTDITDEHLYIATLESKTYANVKIGAFTSDISIMTIMNYLYAGVFLLDYDRNYQLLLEDRIMFFDDQYLI
ncbi:MAG: MurR/RpiR family transcriptional regulator [Eubacteriales bacterium]|nr:MurR/RpiR family transcriptional regulator [Eubacteriales bacterium]